MRQNAKKTRKVSKYEEKEEANMDLARKLDNALAIGSMLTIFIIGKAFHWYDFYIGEKLLEAGMVFAFWRLPLLGMCYLFNPRERDFWASAIKKYFLPDYLADPETIKETTK